MKGENFHVNTIKYTTFGICLLQNYSLKTQNNVQNLETITKLKQYKIFETSRLNIDTVTYKNVTYLLKISKPRNIKSIIITRTLIKASLKI